MYVQYCKYFTLCWLNVSVSFSADDPPHEVCFAQPEYRVKEDDGGVDVSVRLNGPTARANITIFVSARSTGNGETDASSTYIYRVMCDDDDRFSVYALCNWSKRTSSPSISVLSF